MFKIASGSVRCLPFIVLLSAVGFAACQPSVEEPSSAETPSADAGESGNLEAAETSVAELSSAEPSAAKIEIKNARTPLTGVLTGGQPTAEQIEQAATAGYRTVVNLRAPGEEGGWDEAPKVEELGMHYVSIPMAGAADITMDNSHQLFEILKDHDNHPVMVHCGSGNRIGALFALHAFHADGQDVETALAVGREAGLTRLEEVVRQMLEGDNQATSSP